MNLDLLVGSFTKDLSASCSGISLPAVLCRSVMSRWEGVCVVAGKLTVCLWSQLYKHIQTYLYIHLYVKFCEVVDCELEAVVHPCLCMCAWDVEEGSYVPLPARVRVVKYGVW